MINLVATTNKMFQVPALIMLTENADHDYLTNEKKIVRSSLCVSYSTSAISLVYLLLSEMLFILLFCNRLNMYLSK